MRHTNITLSVLILWMLVISCRHEILQQPDQPDAGGSTSTTCSADTVYFQQQVLPIFISNCSMSGCHNEASHEGGIILTNYSSIITTGKVRAFSPNSGDVYKKITTSSSGDRMPPPPMNALTASQKDAIYTWIMQGAKNNSCDMACDSSVYSYGAGILPILSVKCVGCHSGSTAQGGIDLGSYTAVKARVADGKLWGSVSHSPGYVAMPQGGQKLSSCELSKFKKWIDAGAPNN